MPGSLVRTDAPSATVVRGGPFVVEIENSRLSGVVLRELARATLQRGKAFRFTAHGYSMAPFIRDGDVITLVPREPRSRPGEVLAFVEPAAQRLIVHRVIARAGHGYVLKGDNVPEQDGIMQDAQLLGRVARVERAGKMVRGVLGTAGWAIALLSRWNLPIAARQAADIPRRMAGKALRRAQILAVYPRLVRPWSPRVDVVEAGTADLIEAQRRLRPGVWQRPPPSDPHVTRYVAKSGMALAGFAELVRRPPGHAPDAGHWLCSLYVWTRYRRLGIGERLILQVMTAARTDGAWELRLLASETDAAALALFHKLGFVRAARPAGDRQPAQEAPPCRVFMSVQLTARPEVL